MIKFLSDVSITEPSTPVFDKLFSFLGFGSLQDCFLTFFFCLLILLFLWIVFLFVDWVFDKIDVMILNHKSNVEYNRFTLTYHKNKFLKDSEEGDQFEKD